MKRCPSLHHPLHHRGLALLLLAGMAQAAPPDVPPDIPHMSRAEALRYLDDERLALAPDNLPAPIMNGDLLKVEALLSAGIDPNGLGDVLPQSVLELAAGSCRNSRLQSGDVLRMIEVLLAHGAKANAPGMGGLSALMIAAQQCKPEIVRRLLKAGADINQRTPQGYTPLSMAFIVGNLDTAEALIEAGARLSAEAASKLLDGHKDDARYKALVARARAK